MHIAIEGLDGVGKTQTAKLLAKTLGFEFIEKPLHYLTDLQGMDNYLRIMNTINTEMGPEFTSLYYGLSNLYLTHLAQGKNVVTDRHLCSTYFWNHTESTAPFFNYLVNVCGSPDFTVILYATEEVRRTRIKGRNPNDPDLNEKVLPNKSYQKMLEFVQRYNMRYIWLDTSDMNLQAVIQQIVSQVHNSREM